MAEFDKNALPWERADTDTPRAAKIVRDYFEKEAVSADDFERDLYEPMQKLERKLAEAKKIQGAQFLRAERAEEQLRSVALSAEPALVQPSLVVIENRGLSPDEIADLAARSSSSSKHTREPGMAPGAELLVETDRNARYWLEGGRKEKKRDEAVLAVEQAMNAWRNAAYAMAARAIQEAEKASAGLRPTRR